MNSHSACKSGRASRSYDWICGKHIFPPLSLSNSCQFSKLNFPRQLPAQSQW